MLMRAVLASAMLIGLAGTAQSEIRIIYPPYSYKAPMNLCDYVLGNYCGYHYIDGRYGYDGYHGYHGYPYHRYDAAVFPYGAHANTANVVVIQPPSIGERRRHRHYKGW